MKYLLGIDIGTAGLKASVFGLRGSLTGRGDAANQYLSGPAGCAEQYPTYLGVIVICIAAVGFYGWRSMEQFYAGGV